ncbi:MAG: acyltransferase family protein, partial [Candidatus Avispirillum sp.]
IPSLVHVDFFEFADGYSFVWLLTLYSIGAYLGRDRENAYFRYIKKFGIAVFFIISFILLFGNIFATKILGFNPNYMVDYTSPLVLLMGLSVLITLSGIKQNLSGKRSGKVIEVLSSTTFDVYIIHSHVLIYDLVLAGAFAWIKGLAWYCIPAVCIACAVAVFSLCSIIGFIRIQLFRIVRINDLIAKLSARIDKLLYKSQIE